MITNKIFSFKNIFIFSLIFVESFYYTLRIPLLMQNGRGESYIALNRFDFTDIIVALISLFLFSFLIIYFFYFFKKKYFFEEKYTDYFILTFIFALIIKIIFDSADYSWHHLGYRNVYPLISDFDLSKFFSFFWFLIPFFTSFFFVFFGYRKINFSKLIQSFSIVFLLLMTWQLVSLFKLHSNLEEQISFKILNRESSKKVLLILFDGFDPEMAFSKKENKFDLKNFEKLKENAVSHNKLYSPARDTLFSIPGILMGKNIDGYKYEDYQFSLLTDDKYLPFEKKNTIFGKIEKLGLNSAITGYGFHPFCKMIKDVKCKVFNEPLKWYDGILHLLHYKLFSAHFLKIGSHRDINPQIIPSMFNFINSESPTNLLFVHNRVPHLCHQCRDGFAGMAQRNFKFKYSKFKKPLTKYEERREGYLLNLLFVDEIVGRILKDLTRNNNYKNKDTLVIFISDHWAKEEINFKTRKIINTESTVVAYPSLFVAKILGDTTKIEINQPDSSIHIPELIELFFKDKIKSHLNINEFFQDKKGYKIFIPKDIEFIVEEDF